MKTAYVTGSDRGLGLAFTALLLEKGYRVFAGQFMPEWPELSELAALYPSTLHMLPLDVTDDGSVKSAADRIGSQTEHLDLLINNAAIFRDRNGTILDPFFPEDMLAIYNTNTVGPLRVTHSVMPLLLKGTEKMLVLLSSEAGSITDNKRIKEYGYTMSKAAINRGAVMLQRHLKEFGVRVLALHPGYVKSYMLGHRNEKATLEPADSAHLLLQVIDQNRDLNGPIYLDYKGNAMSW